MGLMGFMGTQFAGGFDEFDNFAEEEYYCADKIIRGKKYTLKSTNPLYLCAFLDLSDKVREGVEKGFLLEGMYEMEMPGKKVQEYAKHPQIKYYKEEQWERDNQSKVKDSQSIKTEARLVVSRPEKEEEEQYSNYWFHMDMMTAAVLGESKQVFLEGLEQRALLDCGVWETRKAVCMCRNEEMLSALMQKECTSFYIEPEDALEYMNPILLRLICESGEKYLKKDIYDRCLEEFVHQYLESNDFESNASNEEMEPDSATEPEPIGWDEWRTYKECIEDFTACMKYLKMQGYRRRRVKFKKIKQENLDFVLQDIEKNAGQKLYQEFLEIVDYD